MSNPSHSRWVPIRRPATVMTSASGGFAGGGWEFPESPLTPPRCRWHTCRPKKWGTLRRAPFHPNKPDYASLPAPQSPPSNPLPMPAMPACLSSTDVSVTGYRTLESPGIGGEPAAGEEFTGESTVADDGLTQAWLDANLEVKIQMKKWGFMCLILMANSEICLYFTLVCLWFLLCSDLIW